MEVLKAAKAAGTATKEEARTVAIAFDNLLRANQRWNGYYEYAMQRYHVGVLSIICQHMPEAAPQLLQWQRNNGTWALKGPSVREPNKWITISPDGREAVEPIGISGVPQKNY